MVLGDQKWFLSRIFLVKVTICYAQNSSVFSINNFQGAASVPASYDALKSNGGMILCLEERTNIDSPILKINLCADLLLLQSQRFWEDGERFSLHPRDAKH
jgi:hypothetical protein